MNFSQQIRLPIFTDTINYFIDCYQMLSIAQAGASEPLRARHGFLVEVVLFPQNRGLSQLVEWIQTKHATFSYPESSPFLVNWWSPKETLG